MIETETSFGIKPEGPSESVFVNPPEGAVMPVISLLRLAEREGVYATLSDKARERLEMYFLTGLPITKIAGIQHVSKQAVNQTIRKAPEMLYKKMTKDVVMRKTTISYREILGIYSDYRIYLAAKKGGE